VSVGGGGQGGQGHLCGDGWASSVPKRSIISMSIGSGKTGLIGPLIIVNGKTRKTLSAVHELAYHVLDRAAERDSVPVHNVPSVGKVEQLTEILERLRHPAAIKTFAVQAKLGVFVPPQQDDVLRLHDLDDRSSMARKLCSSPVASEPSDQAGPTMMATVYRSCLSFPFNLGGGLVQ